MSPIDALSRRALLGGAATLVAAGLLAHVPAHAQGARAEAPSQRGTLKIHLLGLGTSDPHRHTGSIAVQQVYAEALTSIADDGCALPYLAESWAIEEGGTRYVFRLRDNVRFHNGRVMTASDVKANAERVRDKVRGGWLSAPMRLVAGLEAPDARTFVMTMKEPYGPLLNLLSELWILAPESEGWDQTIRTPIGTGPFRWGRWVPNEVFHAPAFEGYWQAGLPRVAAVEFSLRDLDDPTLALRAGDLHIARARAAGLPELARDPAIEVQFMKDTSWFFWSFNNRSPRPPFDRVAVRQAITYAMDKPALMRLVAGEAGVVTNQMAAPGQFWFDQALHDADAHARPDLDRARAMLRAEGVDPARTPLRIVSWQQDYAQAAALAILVFSVWLGWLPVRGQMLSPVLILALDIAGQIAKPLHEELKEVAASAFIRAARAKGLGRAAIVWRHVLPNAAGVLAAVSGLVLGELVGGALTMEVMFGLPGLGTLAFQAIAGRDYPVVQAVIVVFALGVIVAKALADLAHRAADPRAGRERMG